MTVYVLQEGYESFIVGVFASIDLAMLSLSLTYPDRKVSVVKCRQASYSGRMITTLEISENGNYPTEYKVTECEVFETAMPISHL